MQNMSPNTTSTDAIVSAAGPDSHVSPQTSISTTSPDDHHHHHHHHHEAVKEEEESKPLIEEEEGEIAKLRSENVELRNHNANLQKRLESKMNNISLTSDNYKPLHRRKSLRVMDYMSRNHSHEHRNAAYRLHLREMEGKEVIGYNQGAYKTESCNHWRDIGMCVHGDRCHFAHGNAELRYTIRSPNFKTEVCRAFLTGNTCPYGDRCHFRHRHGSS